MQTVTRRRMYLNMVNAYKSWVDKEILLLLLTGSIKLIYRREN